MNASRVQRTKFKATSKHEDNIFDYPLFYISMIQNENFQNLDRIIKPFDLGRIEFRVLACLHDRDGLGIGELANMCLVKHSAVSVLTQSMEERGLVKRVRDEKDHRVTRVKITAAGRRKANDLMPLIFEHQKFLTGDLTKREYDELMRLLKNIYSRVLEAQRVSRER